MNRTSPFQTFFRREHLAREYICRQVVDQDGDRCGDVAVVVHIEKDEGQCALHLVIQKAYPLSQLGQLVDRYWNGEGY